MANAETAYLDAVIRDWETDPLFGRIGNGESSNSAEPWQRITWQLAGKAANIRVLDKNTAQIVLPPADDSRRTDNLKHVHPSRQLERRLDQIQETYEEWRFVGCALCYATTGEQEPDHSIDRCTRWPSSDRARRILCWLESLRIPRYFEHRGACSYCAHGWVVCGEIRMAHQIDETRDPEYRAQLVRMCESKPGPDGYCENRRLVRSMVAALCAYDDQILGRVLHLVALDGDGVNLGSEQQARQWFEQRIRTSQGRWVPRLILVLDQLVLAMRFRNAERHDQKRQVAEVDWSAPPRWNNELEVADWKAVLDWLVGRCTFCAGRGYKEELIRHKLRKCQRGGASTVKKGLGDVFYNDGFLPSGGCDVCLLPREFCARWTRAPDGNWAQDGRARCTYSKRLLLDSIVGFAECGKEKYWMDLVEGVEEDMEMEKSVDDEAKAIWLSEDLVVAGVHGSQMIRQLTFWTRDLKSYQSRE